MTNRILLLVDDPHVLSALTASLTEEGFAVATMSEHSDTVEPHDNPFLDLILVDTRNSLSFGELVGRIKQLLQSWRDLRRLALLEFCFGSVHIDFVSGVVHRDGIPVSLSSKELQLLRFLISRRGAVLSRKEILTSVWGYRAVITRTLDVHIAGLRQKLEQTPHRPRYILTARGHGYIFRE